MAHDHKRIRKQQPDVGFDLDFFLVFWVNKSYEREKEKEFMENFSSWKIRSLAMMWRVRRRMSNN